MTSQLPTTLYRAAQLRELDRLAIERQQLPATNLMERAGSAAFTHLRQRWPKARRISVLCGIGNNAGDGFVVARLAHTAGLEVELLQLGNRDRLRSDARYHAELWQTLGGELLRFERINPRTEVIVDALFGTGLEREVTGTWATAIHAINQHPAAVLALDLPSGLHADHGRIMGTAVKADSTITFIGLKPGMFTGEGPEQCGEIQFNDLGLAPALYREVAVAAYRDGWHEAGYDGNLRLPPRRRTAHKGDHGHLLVIGGDSGLSGAPRLAAEAALRSGCGLVTLATHPDHARYLNATRPELMIHPVEHPRQLKTLLQRAQVIVIGPGLGQSAWSHALWQAVIDLPQPKIVDADALNLLAAAPCHRNDWILTPHPGEAARLLAISAAEIQDQRFQAIHRLQQRYGGIVILKGPGTLISSPAESVPLLCSQGNPGMASGGMGDLLAGLIGSLVAQKLDLTTAARLAVLLHATAADYTAERLGQRGLLASDLLPELQRLVNVGGGGEMRDARC